MRTDLWFSSTSDAEQFVTLYVGLPENEYSPSFSQDDDVMTLEDKCIVIRFFFKIVCTKLLICGFIKPSHLSSTFFFWYY